MGTNGFEPQTSRAGGAQFTHLGQVAVTLLEAPGTIQTFVRCTSLSTIDIFWRPAQIISLLQLHAMYASGYITLRCNPT